MKRTIVLVSTLVMLMGFGIGSALAANSLKAGTIGLNADVNDDFVITGKYFLADNLALLAGFGFGAMGGDASGTDIGLLVGVRKYLKADDFAPFAGGRFEYRSTLDSNQKDLVLMAEAGAECFLSKQFSIEGSVGFGYVSSETKTATTYKSTDIGTQKAGLSVNFYF